MRKWLIKGAERLVHYSNHWWYGPFIGLLAALDAFVFIVSVEAILFPSVWAHPRKWLSTGLWLTLGSALGATCFAILASIYGEPLVAHFFPHLLESKNWQHALSLIDQHGAWGLAFISFSPVPQHFGVAIAGLAHMKPWVILGAVLFGRGAKYIPLAWAATHAPRLLKKMKILPADLTESFPEKVSTKDNL